MTEIIGISGSLRKGSYNTSLLRAATNLVPEGAELIPFTLHGIPLYNGDEETENGIPPGVAALKDEIIEADALLIVTPEYNNSMPGVLKNGIDWLSRPPADTAKVFKDKPVAIMGASPGGFGTILSQNAWLPVIKTLGMRPYFGGKMLVSRAHTVFDANGDLTDDAVREQLREFLHGFAVFVEESTR